MNSDTKQSPMEEMGERVAEVLPGLKALGAMVGLEHHRQMMHDHQAQIRRDLRNANTMLGYPSDDVSASDPMGDMIICGDIHVGDSQKAEEVLRALKGKVIEQSGKVGTQAAGITSKVDDLKNNMPGWLKAALIATAIGGTGIGGAALGAWLNAPAAPKVIDTDTDTNSALQFKAE